MKLDLSDKEKYVIEHIRYILSYVFQALFLLFLLTLLLQQFYPAQVNSRININWFMIVVIVIGALSILFPIKKQSEDNPVTKKDIFLVVILGVMGGILIYIKTQSLGWIGYVLSALGGLIIILLSWLILTEKPEDNSGED